MAKILIDNWSIQKAAISINNTYEMREDPDEAYIDLIEAIILWDDIYYIENEFSVFWKNILWRFGFAHYLKPLSKEEISDCDTIVQNHLNAINENLGILERGAIEYYLLSNLLQMNYLPSSERTSYLIKNNYFNEFIIRNDIIKMLDKSILDYYSEINEELGVERIKFERPLLFDYVANNTYDSRFYINTALQIKKAKEVINFRRWMDNFESVVNSGNIYELKRQILLVHEIVNEVTKLPNSKILGEVQLGLSPSISFPFNIHKNNDKKIHTNFLRTLTYQAIHNRKPTEVRLFPNCRY